MVVHFRLYCLLQSCKFLFFDWVLLIFDNLIYLVVDSADFGFFIFNHLHMRVDQFDAILLICLVDLSSKFSDGIAVDVLETSGLFVDRLFQVLAFGGSVHNTPIELINLFSVFA